jgi:hypothetical protein
MTLVMRAAANVIFFVLFCVLFFSVGDEELPFNFLAGAQGIQ